MGPHYLLSGENDDDESTLALADELDDDDIAPDAEEEAAAAEAEARKTRLATRSMVRSLTRRRRSRSSRPLRWSLSSPVRLVTSLARAPSWEVAHAWVETDPVNVLGGYGTAAQLHQWLVSDDEVECSADGRDDSVVRRSLPR